MGLKFRVDLQQNSIGVYVLVGKLFIIFSLDIVYQCVCRHSSYQTFVHSLISFMGAGGKSRVWDSNRRHRKYVSSLIVLSGVVRVVRDIGLLWFGIVVVVRGCDVIGDGLLLVFV